MTWFRRDRRIVWLAAGGARPADDTVDLVEAAELLLRLPQLDGVGRPIDWRQAAIGAGSRPARARRAEQGSEQRRTLPRRAGSGPGRPSR